MLLLLLLPYKACWIIEIQGQPHIALVLAHPVIIDLNSSKSTNPSPSLSTPLIIRLHSWRLHLTHPRLIRTRCNSSADITPFLSESKIRKASIRPSSQVLLLPTVKSVFMTRMNSSKSMNPSPLQSTSLTMPSASSTAVDFSCPSHRSTSLSSKEDILPSPFVSRSLNTCFSWLDTSIAVKDEVNKSKPENNLLCCLRLHRWNLSKTLTCWRTVLAAATGHLKQVNMVWKRGNDGETVGRLKKWLGVRNDY